MEKKRKNKLAVALSAIGPGLFLIGYNIGTGSVTTMAKTGAEHGMSLFWALVLSCIFTYVLMVAYGRVTIVSGKTALTNFRTEFKNGWILALYVLIVLIIGELLALMGIMGIVADLLQEGIRMLTNGAVVSTPAIILFLALGLSILLWVGNYQSFEKILTFFVILMGVSFIVVFILVKPDMGVIAQGLIPRIPDQPGAYGLVAAIAGTTCSAAVFIMRSVVVAEKGWSVKDVKTEKRDSLVSASMMLLLSGVIMAVAAGTLHVMGLKVDNTLDLIHLFEPLGGEIAAYILILGVVGAGLSTIFPIVLIAPWLVSDFTGKPRNLKSTQSRILILLGMAFAFGSIFLKHSPPILMVFSQAFQATILPVVSIPIFMLINRESLMEGYTAKIGENIALVATILFSLFTTYFALVDFFG